MSREDLVVKLIVISAGKPKSCVEVGECLTIGRSPSQQLVVADPHASRSHAEIRRIAAGRYLLSDLGSVNGTWLNGRRVTIPKELKNGDEMRIGTYRLRYVAPNPPCDTGPSIAGTKVSIRNELVVVLVADIRGFSRMSVSLPNSELSALISTWYRESSYILEKHGATIDKFIGDAVMAYWVVAFRSQPAKEVNAALDAARDLLQHAASLSPLIASRFPGDSFRIGIGLNLGNAVLSNVGTREDQSFTLLGDSVNAAFHLETLTKQKNTPVLTSRLIVDYAREKNRFRDFGLAELKGRTEPLSIWAPDFGPNTGAQDAERTRS